MPPLPWATKEEAEFLENKLAEYQIVQETKHYTHFWARLFEDWFTQWPEQPRLFSNNAEGILTIEENEQLGKAQKIRRRVRHA